MGMNTTVSSPEFDVGGGLNDPMWEEVAAEPHEPLLKLTEDAAPPASLEGKLKGEAAAVQSKVEKELSELAQQAKNEMEGEKVMKQGESLEVLADQFAEAGDAEAAETLKKEGAALKSMG